MITKSINVFNLNVPCCNCCRYCLLSWSGDVLGIDYDRSVKFADKFYNWLKENRPEIKFTYYFGYSMEHPKLLDVIKFMQKTNSPGGEFLQFDGMRKRTKEELNTFLNELKNVGIKLIDMTFYGDESYHDQFAGRKGDYQLMLDTIDVALGVGIDVQVGIPVMKDNLNQLDGLVEAFLQKNIRLHLFTPHSGGRGKTIQNQKIALLDYEKMSDKVKKQFNRNGNKTPLEWLNQPPKEVKSRVLTLSLLKSNIEDLEKKSFEEIIANLEQMDDEFYSQIPSFDELLEKYADKNDCHLYTKKDLYSIYRTRYFRENNLKITDITDERFCGSIRY